MDGNCALEFKTVTVALVGLVTAGIVAAVTVVATVVAIVAAAAAAAVVCGGFDFELSFNSPILVVVVVVVFAVRSFKFVSLAKIFVTSIVFAELVFRIDIFCLHLTSHTDFNFNFKVFLTL